MLSVSVLAATLVGSSLFLPQPAVEVTAPMPGFFIGAGSSLAHGTVASAHCTAGFLLRVDGRRQILMSGRCAGALGSTVTSGASHELKIGTVAANGLTPTAGETPVDAAIFTPRPGIWADNSFLTHGGRVHGWVDTVAAEQDLVGSPYLRSGQGTEKTSGVITDSRIINGRRHYCGDGPAITPGDLGGPVVLSDESGRPKSAAGIATINGDDGRMCFLPMSTLLTTFRAELGKGGSD